ncbi:MAG TPA: CpsD/CapB family tyrosine-protein kinase [Pyrinomonadaceae bacterium]|nr:CpsD/CapB family tyrosine-protein kinase [Pyrinomonadaceae bacterium]
MSILKALQKKQSETGDEAEIVLEIPKNSASSKVVPFDIKTRRMTRPPEMFGEKEFKIGTPSSAFNRQSDSLIGMALPDSRTEIAVGAKLNAVVTTRPAEKTLPEFTEWEIEAERVEPRLVAITQPHSTYCEEYRSLRTHILHKSQTKKLQAIVVASINPSEGKSITALNLSWMLAQTDGLKCLVIDSDLRMPSLADYLGIETEKGLSDILAGTCSVKDAIIKITPSGLYILPGGDARNDVAELISGPKFKEILREVRDMFDYVIIDAPPLGIFTDAAVLINQADGAMLVIRAGKTRYSAVDRVMETVPRERMLGVVLNQSEDVLDESHYNYGYYKTGKQ